MVKRGPAAIVMTAIELKRVSVCLVLLAFAATWAAEPAAASTPLSDFNVSGVSLEVNRAGQALVSYTRQDGSPRHVLVSGAINARTPDPSVPQVRFRFDYAGGWGTYRRAVWRAFRNVCRAYDGPQLPLLVAACTAPDGSYWTLQSWQRALPNLGFAPWLPSQTNWELQVSHWSGPLPRLEVYTNWTYGGQFQGLFGRLTYNDVPVHGFGTTALGNPRDYYGRNVYIDTLNSAYGPGWYREAGIVVHRPTGTFCHSFVPTKPFAHYPSTEIRPAANGERYRVTVMGPGVTPIVVWEGQGLHRFDPSNPADVADDDRANATFDQVMAGDRICVRER